MLELPYSISLPALNSVVVHAGLVPHVPLHLQQPITLTKTRNIKRRLGVALAYEKPVDGGPWAASWTGPQHVYFGHDAKRGLQLHPFATGLDTGCCYGTL